jgi:hypothetical protein
MNIKRQIFPVFLLTVTAVANLSGQQTKRNLLSNSRFEEGLKNWRQKSNDGAVRYSVEETAPISGAKSARIDVVSESPDKTSAMLYYLLPVEKNAKYLIRFKAKASKACRLQLAFAQNHPDTTALETDSVPENFISQTTPSSLRGSVWLGTTVDEYIFLTNGSQAAGWNYLFAFYFGQSEAGATYWIDDIHISRSDNGDWDGNDETSGVFLRLDPSVSTETQTVVLNSSTANGGNKSNSGSYTSNYEGLFNTAGNLIFAAENIRDVDTSALSSGIYTVKSAQTTGKKSKRLL